MSAEQALAFVLCAWIVEATAKWLLIDKWMGLSVGQRKPNYERLKSRLQAYALMKASRTQEDSANKDSLLDHRSHEILLGALKKVEAKNAVLATFWSIVVAALVAVATIDDGLLAPVALIAVFAPFLTSILWCAVQLDQIGTNAILDRSNDQETHAKEMQESLMKDLLRKEAAFRFSWLGAIAVVYFAILVSGAYVIENSRGLLPDTNPCGSKITFSLQVAEGCKP